jgi:hypothetical protein
VEAVDRLQWPSQLYSTRVEQLDCVESVLQVVLAFEIAGSMQSVGLPSARETDRTWPTRHVKEVIWHLSA